MVHCTNEAFCVAVVMTLLFTLLISFLFLLVLVIIVLVAVRILTYFARGEIIWMQGISLSVIGSVGVIVISACIIGRAYPFNEVILCCVVFCTISLSAGLIMAIQGLKKM